MSGTLHPVYGTAVETSLGRIEHELFERDWAQAKAIHGDDTRLEHLARTAGQRRHDALVVMAMRAEAWHPGSATRRPLISVLVDWPTMHGRICELEDGTHLSVDQALHVLTVADVERAVFESPDRISVSKRARVFRGAERRKVELRDRHCTERDCEIGPEQCDVDHTKRYEHGGETVLGNGKLKCAHHNPGRRSETTRKLPWEHHEDRWDDFDNDGPLDLDEEFRHWQPQPPDDPPAAA